MPGPGFSAFGEQERANVLAVLDRWARRRDAFGDPGEAETVRDFERATAGKFGADHCLALNSGTSALIAALAGLGIGPGDEVIVPGYMFVATIAAVVHSGADPVLAEVDESLTLDPVDVRARITPRTRAILPVHMLGAPADLAALTAIAEEHGLALVEDCAQAAGGSYRGRRLGTIGAVGAFSLNHFKVITALDGGFLLTGDPKLFQRAYSFHDQGWFPYREDVGDGDLLVGMNLRLSELNAAVGLAQVAKLDAILARLRARKRALVEEVGDLPGVRRRPLHDADGECATLAVYLFDDARHAEATAGLLGATTLLDSPKHYYGGLPELAAFGRGERGPVPFRAPINPATEVDFGPGALPRTDDVLGRSVALAVGVSDDYLGAGFGLTARGDGAEVVEVAARFREAVLAG
ncbi:DegT/DnrJ/EryC1/StrS aminotransferase family protein [Actinokineospora spheciospongiae]|uniref:DegT/DnrJ/EryC1/StrS aminotransferase family protein n=1 Tax=Actinokineospora spheciospongiae TaxID=909613 RepID=UPI000D70B208|nr:DegT/DnrJ/EryC1/StrS family aminotransferase [Actinokineospora spheciospongiae]PWW60368.1 dTDP-4-amino-4,6-dideoxygalactose transaminase [Actinokineospora spheciospongiae]